jgi:ribosome-associated protein
METFKIKGEFIQLNQLLKMMGWSGSGAESNAIIESGAVKVNGIQELRKRNKIFPGFIIEFDGHSVTVE